MLEILKSIKGKIATIDSFENGSWINLVNPSDAELDYLTSELKVDLDMIKAALDEEETARLESENGQLLIVVDIPVIEKEGRMNVYTTVPLGIVVYKQFIITICLKSDTLLTDFINNQVKAFYTQFRTRFILQILYKNAARYLQYLRHIDKISGRIEEDLHKSTKNKELIQMLKLQKSLVYFSTSLKSNEVILEKLMKFEYIKKYVDDQELLEDVIIENKQAIEMTGIYSSILASTMDTFASVISNNVNLIMKFLTTVTIIMAIPNMIYGFFGMNVFIPNTATNNYMFLYILFLSLFLCLFAGFLLYKKKNF